jgi:hypothetical protein
MQKVLIKLIKIKQKYNLESLYTAHPLPRNIDETMISLKSENKPSG